MRPEDVAERLRNGTLDMIWPNVGTPCDNLHTMRHCDIHRLVERRMRVNADTFIMLIVALMTEVVDVSESIVGAFKRMIYRHPVVILKVHTHISFPYDDGMRGLIQLGENEDELWGMTRMGPRCMRFQEWVNYLHSSLVSSFKLDMVYNCSFRVLRTWSSRWFNKKHPPRIFHVDTQYEPIHVDFKPIPM